MFPVRKRLSGCKKILARAHWEVKSKNSTLDEAIDYCSKDGDFESYGERPAGAGRSDLLRVRDFIRNGGKSDVLADTHFALWVQYRRAFQAYESICRRREKVVPRVVALEGLTGVGKSRFAWEFGSKIGTVWFSSDPSLQWFDGYNGDSVAVLDDFDGKGVNYRFLLRLLDRYPLSVPVKGGFVDWNPDYIIITTNVFIEQWFPCEDISPLKRRVKWINMEGEYNFEDIKRRLDE